MVSFFGLLLDPLGTRLRRELDGLGWAGFVLEHGTGGKGVSKDGRLDWLLGICNGSRYVSYCRYSAVR